MAATVPAPRRRIVIVGGGFGGAFCALELERHARRLLLDVVLLDRNNYFVFHPLLIEAGTGSLEPRHTVVPLRSFLKKTEFQMGEVLAVDARRRVVSFKISDTEEVREIEYHHLVVAIGSVTRLPPVPGLREFGFEMKSLGDSVALRDRSIQLLERANTVSDESLRRALLHFVVVGSNFTGVEVAGEFHEFLQKASRSYPNLRPSECRVTLVERGPRILNAVDEDLAQYAAKSLSRRGIEILLKDSVIEVEEGRVKLQNVGSLDTHTLVWCAGIAPNPLAEKLPLMRDGNGYILCEPTMRAKGMGDIWAIGDCAVIPNSDGKNLPPTAQAAVQAGKLLAQNIARTLEKKNLLTARIANQGSLAAIGCRTAVARLFGLKLSGFPAWFLWRTVYLMKMPTLSRKLRVAMDWTLDLFFARDYVQLGVHKKPR